MQARFSVAAAAALIVAALVAGCAVTPPPAPAPPGGKTAVPLETGGRYQAAAEAWMAAAARMSGSAQAEARLRAAQDYERAKQPAAAWRAVAPVEIAILPAKQQFTGAETKARLALAVQRPKDALAALAAAPTPPNREDELSLLALKGRAQFAVGNAGEGLETLVHRGTLVTNSDAVLANDKLIWGLLTKTPNLPATTGLSSTARGWVELADIQLGAWLEPGEFAKRLQAWRVAYPNHPADYGLIAEIQSRAQTRANYPAQVALLLPLSGPYATQGQAVEEGLLAAFYLGGEPRPRLAVYDTKGGAAGASAALGRAIGDGADFIVGPLTVAGVASVASAHPSVPVLALNYLTGGAAPARFFQFGLSPQQEASGVAERAVAQGLMRAVMLVPADDWGSGIATAFTQTLSRLGGQVLASTTYTPGAVHFGSQLSALFGGGAGEFAPAGTSSAKPEFNQQRRADIQFIFFAAPYSTARLIVPQISYYQGLGLPVYSLSAVYRPGGATSDLDGVRFPIMPWFASGGPIAGVRGSVESLFPQNWDDLAPLYALGYDAWRLVPLLGPGAHQVAWSVRGMTGTLGLGPDNVIQRRADWAHYVDGRVRPLISQPVP